MVKKHQSNVTGIEDQIIALYAKGISTRDIQDHLENMYGIEVSPTLISNVTNKIILLIKEWQKRPLQGVYAVVFLAGFTQVISACYPKTEIQKCIIHQIRNSTRYVSYKDLKKVTADLKPIYKAASEEMALVELDRFEEAWGTKYPLILRSWRNNWDELAAFFKYPPEIRKHQIKELINAIVGGTDQAVVSMGTTVEQSSRGIAAIQSVEQTFKDIQRSVNNVTLQMQEVYAATQQMKEPIDHISSSVNQIANISTDAASQTQQVSVSVEEQSASSGEINASAASLAKMAEELQELVQKFKI